MKRLKNYILPAIIILWVVIASVATSRLHQAERGDLNHDGIVDIRDQSILSRNWHK